MNRVSRRSAVRGRIRDVGCAIAAAVAFAAGCDQTAPTGSSSSKQAVSPPEPAAKNEAEKSTEGASGIRFREVADTGITWTHHSGKDDNKYFPSTLGSGVAMVDYDGDGRIDLYFASTRNLPLSAPDQSQGNRLYRNLGGWKFEDVTAKAGVGFRGFCHGVAVGDVNNDGRPDLYLTNYGGNVLYINNGDGTFRNATAGSGVELGIWTAGAAFVDFDSDGVLDLYVSCYCVWDDKNGPNEYCGDKGRGLRMYCSPYQFAPQRNYLFHGLGGGRFEDVTAKAGVLRSDARGLGVIAADVNRDGKTDIYVANDASPNFLFLNRGDGTFDDATESSGASLNAAGEIGGSMGLDVQDLDGDGLPEVLVTNFRGKYNTLYRNLDGHNYQDVTAAAGTVKDSLFYVGWGCGLADLDNDGLCDMLVANGEVDDNLIKFDFSAEYSYAQPTIVWRNEGRMKFRRVADPGPFFAARHPARGAALGDLDDDGDLDVVIVRQDMPPALLENVSPDQGNWLRVELKPTRSNRSAIGASVDVYAAGGVRLSRQQKGGDSYLSANDPRLLVGLGKAKSIDRVEVYWPSGAVSKIANPEINRSLVIREPADAKGGGAEVAP